MTDIKRPCSLVLASHGSMAAPDSNAPMIDLADRIRKLNLFDAVTPAFLNGQPLMTDFLSLLPKGDVVIVPVMTSVGYYLQSVIPKRIAENPQHSDYRIFISPVVAMHEKIVGLVAARIRKTMQAETATADDTTVVVVGHGTRRNANSARSTYDLVDSLKRMEPDLKFKIAFLDQDPEACDVAKTVVTPNTIVVPFLISRGPHTTVDIPEAFDLPAGPDVVFPNRVKTDGGFTLCDLPVGMYDEIAELCVELAQDQLQTGQPVELPAFEPSS